MANALITPDIIAKEALMQLQNNLGMAKYVHREYKNEFKKIGNSVDIRKPVKFQAITGATRVNQDVEESTTAVTIDQRKHVSWKFSTQDLTLTVEEYSERYIKPAAIALSNTVDQSLHGLYTSIWNHVGTPGSTPNDYADVALVAQRMDEMAVPNDGMRHLCVNPAAGHAIANTATTLYINQVNNEAYRNGSIGELAGINTMRTQNVQNHTVGTWGSDTPLVNGGSQGTTYAASKATYTQTLVTDDWSNSVTGVLKAGDVINIAGVYSVNPIPADGASASAATKTVYPDLQDFVVTADADSDGSGNATLTISPPIITSGPFQTVSAEPADNAAITVKTGTSATAYPQHMGFHKNALALVTVPLELPDGAAFKSRESDEGLSIRVVKDYDIDADEDIIRMDILYGIKAIYPELACRLTG